jgi:NADP-dependent 3-hydroxy acid dehydrogenase YdfG
MTWSRCRDLGLLAERGAVVALGARRTDRLGKLAQEIRGNGGRGDITIRPTVQG